MGSLITSELSLDCRFLSASAIGEFLTQVPRFHGQSERMAKLDDYVNGLEVEIKKIEVFKRELPLCMRIVNQAIVIMKEELAQRKKSKTVPVLKEFIPLKRTNDEKDEKIEIGKENDINSRDKMNWLSSVQLCNSRDQNHHPISGSGNNNQTSKLDKIKGVEEEMSPPMMNGLRLSGINMAVGAAFVPFKGRNNFPMMMMGKEDGDEFNVPHGLTPRDLGIKNPGDEIDSGGFSSKSSCSRSGSSSGTNDQSNLRAQQRSQQMVRKQRRCWSPELHRRFVDALQQLGGAQAATPKQIRELMQVDGLSNDEVKSHLQKYRLHTRKASTMHPSTNPVVLGGSWMPKEQYSESSKLGNSLSGSPQGHMQATGSSRGTSLTGGDSMDDEDDEKSESQSWKNQIQLSTRDGH